MSDFSNGLTPAQVERLATLIEEAAEVQQIACKILRHGYSSYHPNDLRKTTNSRLLTKELADFSAIYGMCLDAGDFNVPSVAEVALSRDRKLQFMHYQGEQK